MIADRDDERATSAAAGRFEDVSGWDSVVVGRPATPPTGVVVVPGSKSLTNRALLLAAMAHGRSQLRGALDAEDTRLMVLALRRLGVAIDVRDGATTLEVTGSGRLASPDDAAPIDVGTSGTVSRFLGAVLAASDAVAELDGTARMRERPLGQLFDALADQGAGIVCHAEPGYLPARITGTHLSGGEVVVADPASSQIVSGLVLAALWADAPTRIVLPDGTPARPYVDMTLATIAAFGGSASWIDDDDAVQVEPSDLQAGRHGIEPDASAATYVWGLAALHGGDLTVPDVGTGSLQGDVGFAEVLGRMGADVEVSDGYVRVAGTGVLRGIDVDLAAMPDPGLTLAALAVRAEGPTRIRGVEVHRHHETDRIAAAATELRRLGADVVEHDDGLDIDPPPEPTVGVTIETYRDHRMAMAFALVGDVAVADPGCVDKTWPEYFAFLDRFCPVAPG